METSEIVSAVNTLISTQGFPIACVAALFWYMVRESDSHKKSEEKFLRAINNNTQAMNELMKAIEKDVKADGAQETGS